MCLADRHEPNCIVAVFFCEQNCLSDFTNNSNNLFFFRSLSQSTLLSMSLRRVSPGGKSVTAAMQVLHDSRHGPYRTVGVFLCLDFFCTFTNNDNDLFSFSSLSHHRSLGPFPARSKRNRARPTRGPVERRFLIEFSSIFMKILACRLSGHPVTFLAMKPKIGDPNRTGTLCVCNSNGQSGLFGPRLTYVEFFFSGTVLFAYRLFRKTFHSPTTNRFMLKI